MSSDRQQPAASPAARPRHVAVIMDGNGRWARARGKPRPHGHRAGAQSARMVVESCAEAGVEALTLFAFSSENWRRPATEVRTLMELFLRALERETERLHENSVRLCFIGERSRFSEKLQERMAHAEALTRDNRRLTLTVAAGYGGRWDLVRATRRIAAQVAAGTLDPANIDESTLQSQLCLSDLPEPDLFIRTGGERRISNFLLWQLAYTELYFTDTLWPDFEREEMSRALDWFAGRQRRYGRTSEQMEPVGGA
jgi:undecaprenyl diphosphate synthase